VVRRGADDCLQMARIIGQSWEDRRDQHSRSDSSLNQSLHGPESLFRWRRSGLQLQPQVSIEGGDAEHHRAPGPRREPGQQVDIAYDQSTLGHQADRTAMIGKRLQTGPSQPIAPFDRLIGIGCRPNRHFLPSPSRPTQLLPQDPGDVGLDEDHPAKVLTCVEVFERMVSAGVTVMAAVNAALIWIQTPLERHPAHAVDCASSGHFFVVCGRHVQRRE